MHIITEDVNRHIFKNPVERVYYVDGNTKIRMTTISVLLFIDHWNLTEERLQLEKTWKDFHFYLTNLFFSKRRRLSAVE